MPTEPSFLKAPGPFLGVSCLPWRWRDQAGVRSPLAVNVDISRGTLRQRPGFLTLSRTLSDGASGIKPQVLGTKAFTSKSGTKLIATLLWDNIDTNNFRTLFVVHDTKGNQVVTPADMSQHPVGLPPDPYGFVTWTQAGSMVLFATPNGGVYYYDYDLDPSTPRALKVNDIFPLPDDKDSARYLETVPRASIIYGFGGVMIYAGLEHNTWLAISSKVADIQTELNASDLDHNRTAYRQGDSILFYSRIGEPTNIYATNYLDVGNGKKITGISSIGGALLVFTEDSVYSAAYDGVAFRSLLPLVQGTGCVSHRSIAQGRGMVAWAGADGFHVYDGQQVRKISDDIEDMFHLHGWRINPIMQMSADKFDNEIPYPFRIAKSQMHLTTGAFDQERQCFWWSVPVEGGSSIHNDIPRRICLLYYPHMDSWSIYVGNGTSSFEPTCFSEFFDGSKYRFLFGETYGGIHAFGEDSADKDIASTGSRGDSREAIAWFWQSAPMEMDDNVTSAARSLRLRQKATGDRAKLASLITNPQWYIDTDRSFDLRIDERPTATGSLDGAPSLASPVNKSKEFLWGNGAWSGFEWHGPSVWRSRYSIDSNVVGQAFYVGFYDLSNVGEDMQAELFGFDIEIQPRRDIT